MSRPTDSEWSALDLDKDPTPGEPATITEFANHVSGIADGIRLALSRFDQLNHAEDDFWESDAAEGFKEIKGELPGDMDLAAKRYEEVGETLHEWVSALSGVQSRADDALRRAKEARDEIDYANDGIDQMEDWKETSERNAREYNEEHPNETPREAEGWSGQDYYALKAAAEEKLRVAKEDVGSAKTDRDNAANHAGSRIEDAYNDELKNKPWWRKALLVLSDILTVVAAIVGVLAIFFPILAPLALGLALASLALTAILVMTGDKTFADLAIELLGLATLGIGRFAATSIRLLRAAPAASKFASASRSFFSARSILSTGKGLPRILGKGFNPATGKTISGAALSRFTVKTQQATALGDMKSALNAYNKIRFPPTPSFKGAMTEIWQNVTLQNPGARGAGLAVVGADLTGLGISGEQVRGAVTNVVDGAAQYQPWEFNRW